MSVRLADLRRPGNIAILVAALSILAAAGFAAARRSPPPDLPTAEVTKGAFVDTLEIRGEIRPLKSIVLSSPMQSGELQILKLATSGTMVKPGDVTSYPTETVETRFVFPTLSDA